MAKRKTFGTCALCLEQKELCCSHILPEFMYGKSYDEDGTFISLSCHPHRGPRPFQVGAWEHLLCSDCESLLNVYETYSAELLRSIDAIPYQGQKGVELDYDYRQFKLFGLSIIWRAHVSKLHEYRGFSIGPLAEHLRRMLLAGDPGPARMCPFGIIRMIGSEAAQHTIHVPVNLKQHGQHVVLFPAFGYWWYFVTSRRSHAVPSSMPFVGFTSKLMIAFERTTDAKFIGWLKTKLTPEMLS